MTSVTFLGDSGASPPPSDHTCGFGLAENRAGANMSEIGGWELTICNLLIRTQKRVALLLFFASCAFSFAALKM
jgi:hypothetical protein